MLLKVERGKSWKERVIRLEDPPEWMTTRLDPIEVHDHLRSPHSVVRALRDNRNRLRIKRDVRNRALRILDAIARTACARGYEVTAPAPGSGYAHAKGYLEVAINGHPNVVDLDELTDKVPHEPTKQELRDRERYSWTRIATQDSVPSGRLRVRILNGSAIRQDSFSDTKTINLEDRLPVVLQELELRAAAAEERDQRLERERKERERRWQERHDAAVVKAREQHRAEALLNQAERWRQVTELDAYLHAMAQRVDELDGDEKAAAAEWLAWAQECRDRLDPSKQSLRMPPDPKFTPDVLAPFMRGLSPYGPTW